MTPEHQEVEIRLDSGSVPSVDESVRRKALAALVPSSKIYGALAPRLLSSSGQVAGGLRAELQAIAVYLCDLSDRLWSASSAENVPKMPRLIQNEIDRLIEKGKTTGLSEEEKAQLDEALDYLDDQTIIELERLKTART